MKPVRMILCLATLALAACGSSGADKDAEKVGTGKASASEGEAGAESMSAEEVAAQMDKAVRPLPGQYESKAELIALDLPGVPADQAAQMKEMMASSFSRTTSRCLTKDEADKGFEELAKGAQEDCKIDSFKVDGAKFAGRMICDTADAKGTVTMKGTGTTTGSDMTMAMDMASDGLPGGRMAMTMGVVSKRVSDCAS